MKRLAAYVLACYLLASWGVNGVLHPMHYIRSMTQQTEELCISESNGDIMITLPEKAKRLETGSSGQQYLSFQVVQAEDYFFSLQLTGPPLHETGTKWVEVKKGWNSIELSDCTWEQIVVPREMAQQERVVLKNAVLSSHRTVDLAQTVYIFMAFLFLALFWECVGWIKKRYAGGF